MKGLGYGLHGAYGQNLSVCRKEIKFGSNPKVGSTIKWIADIDLLRMRLNRAHTHFFQITPFQKEMNLSETDIHDYEKN